MKRSESAIATEKDEEKRKISFQRFNLGPLMVIITDYGHTKAKSLILCSPNSNPK